MAAAMKGDVIKVSVSWPKHLKCFRAGIWTANPSIKNVQPTNWATTAKWHLLRNFHFLLEKKDKRLQLCID